MRRLACFSCTDRPAVGARAASAQVTPAAGYTPPDDTPSIRVGVTLYADYTYTGQPADKGCRRQCDQRQRLQRVAQLHQRHRQHQPHGGLSHYAGHRPAERPHHARPRQQHLERQPALPDQVRVRAVQPRRLDDQGIVGAVRHPADTAARLRRRHLPVPFSGHDVHRARRVLQLGRRRRVVPLERAVELRRRPHRGLQRRGLREDRSQRPEGDRNARHAAAVREGQAHFPRAAGDGFLFR